MPLIYVQSYSNPVVVGGTQYVSGTLQFTGPTTIELIGSVFENNNKYVLFDYAGGSFSGDLSNVTVDYSLIPGVTSAVLTDEPANSRIVLTLS